MECHSCGFRVSQSATTCAVCGEALALFTAEAAPAPSVGALPARPVVRYGLSSSLAELSVLTASRYAQVRIEVADDPDAGLGAGGRCAACGGELEAEARFCSDCGAPVGAAGPAPHDEPLETAPPAVYDEPLDVPFLVEEEPVPVAPPAVEAAPEPEADDDPPPTASFPTAPLFADREAERAEASRLPNVAAALAGVMLLGAIWVHLFSPVSLPGFSIAEIDLKVQMRAVQWLLGGILVALVGLLLKR